MIELNINTDKPILNESKDCYYMIKSLINGLNNYCDIYDTK